MSTETLFTMGKCLTPTVFTTGIKAAAGVAVAGVAKAIQSLEGVTEEKIIQKMNDSNVEFQNMLREAKGSCNSFPNDMTEDVILKNLLCRIIKNKQNEQSELTEQTFQDLCSIINIYSNNKFIAFPKAVYDSEKQAATDALVTGIAGTGLMNSAIDAGMAAAKVGKSSATGTSKDFLNAVTPSATPSSPVDAAVTSISTAGVPITASLGVFFVGIELFKYYNKKIPTQYIPDFNVIVTAVIERQQQINKLNTSYNECRKKKMNGVVKTLKNMFNEAYNNNPQNSNTINYEIKTTGKTVLVKYSDLDIKNFIIKNKAVSYNNFIEAIAKKCNEELQINQKITQLKQEIDIITRVFNKLKSKLNITNFSEENKHNLFEISQEISTLLTNINLQTITLDEIQQINTKIDSITSGQNYGILDPSVPGVKTISKVSSLFGKGGKKSRKSRKLRKRKTQKHKVKTYRLRR